MKKLRKLASKLLAMVVAVTAIVGSADTLTVKAAEKLPVIKAKVPGCNAEFYMENVYTNYGLTTDSNGIVNYWFVFPD